MRIMKSLQALNLVEKIPMYLKVMMKIGSVIQQVREGRQLNLQFPIPGGGGIFPIPGGGGKDADVRPPRGGERPGGGGGKIFEVRPPGGGRPPDGGGGGALIGDEGGGGGFGIWTSIYYIPRSISSHYELYYNYRRRALVPLHSHTIIPNVSTTKFYSYHQQN